MAKAIIADKPGGPDVLAFRDIDVPPPGKGEARVRHTAIGVNFIDVYFRTGLYPFPASGGLTLGAEAAGVVEAIGEGVTRVKPGDRVAYVHTQGSYVTERNLPEAVLVPIPDGVADEVAAAATLKGLTAHYLLHHSFPVQQGQTVLVHAAAGGVGLIVGQWLKALGVTAIGTAGGPEKCALAKAHGYGDVIDYRSEDFVARVMDLTGGKGVDAVYDSVGKDTIPGSLKVLKRFGTLVSFGQSSGPATDFKITDLSVGSLRLTRPTLFHFIAEPGWLDRAAADLFGMIADGKITIDIHARVPLAQAAEAHAALEGRKTTGSTVLVP